MSVDAEREMDLYDGATVDVVSVNKREGQMILKVGGEVYLKVQWTKFPQLSLHELLVGKDNYSYARPSLLYQEMRSMGLTCAILLQVDGVQADEFLKDFLLETEKTLRADKLDYSDLAALALITEELPVGKARTSACMLCSELGRVLAQAGHAALEVTRKEGARLEEGDDIPF